MPVDVVAGEPHARLVGEEVDGDLIIRVASASAYNVTHDRITPVTLCVVRAMNYMECMLVGAV